jgi:hypothetical protein
MNSPVRVIHFARVAGMIAAPSEEAGEIVARVWLGEFPVAASGAIVRTCAGWYYAAAEASASALKPLRSTHSRADLERQIVRFYRGEVADNFEPLAVAS